MSVTHLWLGLALDQAGRAIEAVTAYEEAVRLSGREPLALAFLAHGLARARRADEARRGLAELEERTHWMALLGVEPRLDPLRSPPGFERLMGAMQLGRG